MSVTKHTPGPWEQSRIMSSSENDKGFRVWAREKVGHARGDRIWIADVSPVIDNDRGDASEQGRGNAFLIQAAPDLLEALRTVEWTGEDHDRDNCWPCCPYCRAIPPGHEGHVGHEADCTVALAIARAEGR